MNTKNHELSKYRFLYFIRYFGDAFFYPYIIYFLTEPTGAPSTSTNLINPLLPLAYPIDIASKIMLILPLVSAFVNPLWAFFSRSSNFNRRLVTLFSFFEAVLIILFGLLGNNLYLTLIVFLLLALVGQPIYLLIDSFTKVYIEINKIEFLKIRIFASSAYIIGAFLAGVILKQTFKNYFFLSMVCVISFIITSLITFFIKKNDDTKIGHLNHRKANIKELLTNYNFIAFTFLFVFIFGVQISFDAFLPTFLKTVYEIGSDKFSYIIAGYVVFEVALMFFLGKFGHRINPKILVYIMIYAQVLRYLIYAIGGNKYFIVAITMLRSVTMTLYIYLFLRLIIKVVRPHNLTIALLLTNSFFQLTKAVFLILGGELLKTNQYSFWYVCGAMLGTLAIPMYHLVTFKKIDYGTN